MRLEIGRRATATQLERVRADRWMPASLIELYTEMNGLVFEWGFRDGRRKPARVGRIEIPTLARNLRGWGLDNGLGAETPGIAASIRLPDLAAFESCSTFPCFAEGKFGVWRSYDDTFDLDVPLGEGTYWVRAVDYLFVPDWFESVCDGEPTPARVVAARERLGLPPLA